MDGNSRGGDAERESEGGRFDGVSRLTDGARREAEESSSVKAEDVGSFDLVKKASELTSAFENIVKIPSYRRVDSRKREE
jgi:hypothetical protein